MPCGGNWRSQIGRSVIVLYADSEVSYDGRAVSRAGRAWRLIIIKPDGTLLIHTDQGYQPMNWQPPGSRISVTETSDGKLIIYSTRQRLGRSLGWLSMV